MLIVDGFATFFRVLVIAVGMLTAAFFLPVSSPRGSGTTGEYYALLLFSVAGQCVMVAANELIMIFIGLEISSIASYVLAGYLRDDKRANEAAIKYFLLGSFATAFLLYGVAWIYGVTGSTYLADIRASLCRRRRGGLADAGGDRRGPDVRRIRLQGLRRGRSRSGRRTSTRARPRPCRRSCRPDPRPPPLPCSCASS